MRWTDRRRMCSRVAIPSTVLTDSAWSAMLGEARIAPDKSFALPLHHLRRGTLHSGSYLYLAHAHAGSRPIAAGFTNKRRDPQQFMVSHVRQRAVCDGSRPMSKYARPQAAAPR